MNGIELYFVGFYKHDAIQCLLAGPFVDSAQADAARSIEAGRAAMIRSSSVYVVCKTTLPFEVVEI